jgi:hypothetical protein
MGIWCFSDDALLVRVVWTNIEAPFVRTASLCSFHEFLMVTNRKSFRFQNCQALMLCKYTCIFNVKLPSSLDDFAWLGQDSEYASVGTDAISLRLNSQSMNRTLSDSYR